MWILVQYFRLIKIIVLCAILISISDEVSGEIDAEWFPSEVVKSVLLDNRCKEECDDRKPRWAPKRKVVVFESIGRGEVSYQELSFIDLDKEGTPTVGMPTVFIRSETKPFSSFYELNEDFYSDKKEERFYSSYISWTLGSETEIKKDDKIETKIIPILIFNKGINEIDTHKIDATSPSILLSLEKKEEGNITYLRCCKGTNTFYLKEGKQIISTSTNVEDKDWEAVVVINGDCSRDKKVVFTSNMAGFCDLYIFELPKKGPVTDLSVIKRLTFDDRMEISPKWLSDGRSIVYSSYKDNNENICLIPDIFAREIEPIQLTTDTTTYELNPVFSPDGKMIAFYSTPDGNKYDLCLIKSNGENMRKIAEDVFKTDIYGPCWTGTSTLIYILASQDKIEVQNVISGEKKAIQTQDAVMGDIDAIYDSFRDRVLVTYSAIDKNTRRKRIFVRWFSL